MVWIYGTYDLRRDFFNNLTLCYGVLNFFLNIYYYTVVTKSVLVVCTISVSKV